MIYDGVMTFAFALQQLGGEQVRSRRISCDDPSSAWDKGFTIANFMRNVGHFTSIPHEIIQVSSRAGEIRGSDGASGVRHGRDST